MHCAGCALRVERALRGCAGVESAGVNLTNGRAWVVFEEGAGREDLFRGAVEAEGFGLGVAPREEALEGRARIDEAKKRFLVALVGALAVMVLGWIGGLRALGKDGGMFLQFLQGLVSAAVVVYAGREFHIGAVRLLRHGRMSMDTLVSLSTLVTLLYSITVLVLSFFWGKCFGWSLYFDSASMVVVFILFGRWLESRAKRKASGVLAELIGMQPHRAMLVVEGQAREVDLAAVVQGDRLLVRLGDWVPVDGVVVEGAVSVDESSITGESVPVRRGVGDSVYAGSMVQHGVATVEAESVGKDSVFGRIVEGVEAAQGSRAPVQRLADKVASVFVPIVLAVSLVTLVGWIAWGGEEGVFRGIVASVAVLAVACPCAMGLATPTAMAVAIGRAAQEHILLRDAAALQRMSEVTDIAFDKTGTLTEGRPRVEESVWLGGDTESRQRYLAVLRGLERASLHPLATAILEWSGEGPEAKIIGLEDVPGYGPRGEYCGEACGVGSVTLLKDFGIATDEVVEHTARWLEEGSVAVSLYLGSRVVLLLRLTDTKRTDSVRAVERLTSFGVATHLLTGDSQVAACSMALELSIGEAHGGLLPADKQAVIEGLQREGKVVAMVGDGVNDTQALAQADVGIAMGSGTGAAIGVADITLVTSDVSALLKLVGLSRRAMRIVRQNLFWAFFYNALAIPVAAGALYPILGWQFDPMVSALAMAMSSVSVVVNSLRLATREKEQ